MKKKINFAHNNQTKNDEKKRKTKCFAQRQKKTTQINIYNMTK